MSLFTLSNLLDGTKRLFVGLQGVKSDSTMETLKTNDDGALKVSAQLTGSTIGKGAIQNVTTAGTRVQLPSFACREVTIIAKKGNIGSIYASPSNDVSSTVYGVDLEAKESFTFNVANTNQIWIDSSINGEGISYVAI